MTLAEIAANCERRLQDLQREVWLGREPTRELLDLAYHLQQAARLAREEDERRLNELQLHLLAAHQLWRAA